MKNIKVLSLAICVFSFANLNASTIKGIDVKGNSRIEKETILFEINCKVGDSYNDETSNDVIKKLNQTGYFNDIIVKIENGILNIEVKENPVINKIAYEGMGHSMKEVFDGIVKLKPRQILSTPLIQETKQIILDMYRGQGFLSASVNTKIVKLPNDRVDLVFEIFEGKPAFVRKITFIGNDSFLSSELKDFLNIQEKNWYHFKMFGGAANKLYDPEKFLEDQKNLIKFYMAQGYADFEIISATAELTKDKKDFYITYYIREGDIYKFGDISVDSKIGKISSDVLKKAVITKKGQVFNNQMVDICLDILRSLAKSYGYNFAVVEPIFVKNSKNKVVDVKFIVKDGPKVYIEKININKNTHTRDYVIRRDLGFDESDPFNQKQVKSAEERVKALGFFKNVSIEADEGSSDDSVVLNVNVEEQSTGEIFAKAGYSSLEKASVGFHMYNPNFIGRGQSLGFDFVFAKLQTDCSIDFAEPRLFGRRLVGNTSLFYNKSKRWHGLIRKQAGGLVGVGYKLAPNWNQNIAYKLHRENLYLNTEKQNDLNEKLNNDAVNKSDSDKSYKDWLDTDDGKEYKKFISSEDDMGIYWGSAVIHTITLDKRNRQMLPSKGFKLSWNTKVSGLGGSIFHMINTWSGSWHHKLYKSIIFNLRGSFSHAMGLGDHKLRVTDALFLGGESLRGFDFYGISPVRGIPKVQLVKAFDDFLIANKDYLTDAQKKFLDDEKDNIEKFIIGENQEFSQDFSKKLSWDTIMLKSIKEDQKDAIQINTLSKMRGRKLGATLAWHGSAELSFPMPILPKDSGVFGTVFVDAGSAWRSLRKYENDETSVLYDDHEIRVATGFSIAWNSPFGLLSAGYAWPLKKTKYDREQRFLFGYGMKFN